MHLTAFQRIFHFSYGASTVRAQLCIEKYISAPRFLSSWTRAMILRLLSELAAINETHITFPKHSAMKMVCLMRWEISNQVITTTPLNVVNLIRNRWKHSVIWLWNWFSHFKARSALIRARAPLHRYSYCIYSDSMASRQKKKTRWQKKVGRKSK